jgi:hypothetical protein
MVIEKLSNIILQSLTPKRFINVYSFFPRLLVSAILSGKRKEISHVLQSLFLYITNLLLVTLLTRHNIRSLSSFLSFLHAFFLSLTNFIM